MEKLQKGDSVINLTKQQWDELLSIESDDFLLTYHKEFSNSLFFEGKYLVHLSGYKSINTLSFEEFKKRAINTFNQ